MKKNLYSLITIIVVFVFLSLWGFYWAIRPIKILSTMTPSDFGVNYEDVSFHTKDNVLIRGWFIPSAKAKVKTIILLHGYPADKGDILPARIFLHPYYNLLFIDFRYFGKSEGRYSTVGKDEVLDLLAAIQYLHSRGLNEVGVWGFSLGGAVALMAASQAPEIKAVIAESSYARLDWMAYEYYRLPLLRYPLAELTRFWAWLFLQYDIKKISPAMAAEKLTIPVLLLHSQKDEVVSFQHALLLQKALRNNPHAKVKFVDSLSHGQPVENYQVIAKEFFNEYLGDVDNSTNPRKRH